MQGQQQYQHQLFHYFDIESLIPNNHLLRKIDKHVDLSFVDELTESFYCPNNGRASVAPELFFRMLVIGYLYGIESDRQLCEEIQFNLASRWFCNLNLEDKVLDHSSLTRIRDRFGLEIFNIFFLEITKQCKKMGLVKGDRPGIKAPTPRKISNKTHVSTTDPDASLAFKNGTPRTLKYKAHITIDADSRVVFLFTYMKILHLFNKSRIKFNY